MAGPGQAPTFAWPAPPQPYAIGYASYGGALPAPIAPTLPAPIASGAHDAAGSASRPRKRRRIVGDQLEALIAAFELDDTPNAAKRELLAAQLGMTCVHLRSRNAS